MKTTDITRWVLVLAVPWLQAGCEPSAVAPRNSGIAACADYATAKVVIMPLTELVSAGDVDKVTKIDIYVSLLDSSGCQIKAPAVFRFELYEQLPRLAEPKGRRITMWPDIDLTGITVNNSYWQDFLRAYKFSLDFDQQTGQSYILQVTCMCPDGKRLCGEFEFKG